MIPDGLTLVTRKRAENVWRCGVSSSSSGSRVIPWSAITLPAAIASRFPSSYISPLRPTPATTTVPEPYLKSARRVIRESDAA
jgi:hypothetical protein